jgi:hypothetical protein
MSQFGRHISAWDRARGVRIALGLVAAMGVSSTATAGTFDFWGIDGSYKATLGYAGAMRMEDPDPDLVDRPVDPLVPVVLPPGQVVGFTNTGLPEHYNYDDGNNNFEKGDLVNNRLSIFGEIQLRKNNYGFVLSGDAFRDEAYLDRNANNSPESINKTEGDTNEFSDEAKAFSGKRARLLEAYVTGDWSLFDDSMFLNVRLGEHVVAWGESLFNSGLMLAMGHADATRAFVPGAEIKEILLPHNQISATLALTPELSLMSYYKFEFDPTEILLPNRRGRPRCGVCLWLNQSCLCGGLSGPVPAAVRYHLQSAGAWRHRWAVTECAAYDQRATA